MLKEHTCHQKVELMLLNVPLDVIDSTVSLGDPTQKVIHTITP